MRTDEVEEINVACSWIPHTDPVVRSWMGPEPKYFTDVPGTFKMFYYGKLQYKTIIIFNISCYTKDLSISVAEKL